MAETTIADKIEEYAKGPAKVTVDGTSVDAPSVDDLIKADIYTKTQAAASKNHMGLSFRQFEPGACG